MIRCFFIRYFFLLATWRDRWHIRDFPLTIPRTGRRYLLVFGSWTYGAIPLILFSIAVMILFGMLSGIIISPDADFLPPIDYWCHLIVSGGSDDQVIATIVTDDGFSKPTGAFGLAFLKRSFKWLHLLLSSCCRFLIRRHVYSVGHFFIVGPRRGFILWECMVDEGETCWGNPILA